MIKRMDKKEHGNIVSADWVGYNQTVDEAHEHYTKELNNEIKYLSQMYEERIQNIMESHIHKEVHTKQMVKVLEENLIKKVGVAEDGSDEIPIIESEDEFASGWNEAIRHIIQKITKESDGN